MSTKAIPVNIGDKFNRWEVISEVFYKTFSGGSKAKFVTCRCQCGTESEIRFAALTSPSKPSISCGCYQVEMCRIKNTVALEIGDSYGRLTVLENLGMRLNGKSERNLALVLCSCGNSEAFEIRVSALTQGKTQSCGCLQRENASKASTTHGMSDTTAYSSWQGMKDRCSNPNNPRADRYYDRGISFPIKWITFEGFWEDMADSWFSGADIDRINFDLGYSKENCRWENRDVGNHNKSKSNCTSDFKRVYYDKSRDKWTARLARNGVTYLQKRFVDEQKAALAYDNISEEIYGDRPNKTKRE